MGTSPFEAVSFDVQMDDACGMSFSAVHKVRAAACEQLEAALLEEYQNREQKIAPLSRLAYQKEREAQDKEKLFALDEAAAKTNASQAEVCVLVEISRAGTCLRSRREQIVCMQLPMRSQRLRGQRIFSPR